MPRRSFLSTLSFTALIFVLTFTASCGDALGCPPEQVLVDGFCVADEAKPKPETELEPEPEPAVELCDGIDNDKDGEVDEDFATLGTTCGRAEQTCRELRWTCSADALGVVCEGIVDPTTPDLCDGLDNDCNGTVDDGFPIGSSCGSSSVGECRLGVWACTSDGGSTCQGEIEPSAEVCDGRDNDCDGDVDNGPTEVCDGIDNDCDGLIDEGVLQTKAGPSGLGSSTVTTVPDGFALIQVVNGGVTVSTYDTDGELVSSAERRDLDAFVVTSVASEGSTAYASIIRLRDREYRTQLVEITAPKGADPRIGIPVSAYDNLNVLMLAFPRMQPRVLTTEAGTHQLIGNGTLTVSGSQDVQLHYVDFYSTNLAAVQNEPSPLTEDGQLIGFDIAPGGPVAWEDDSKVYFGKYSVQSGLPQSPAFRSGGKPSVVGAEDGSFGLAYVDDDDYIMLSEFADYDNRCVDTGGICELRVGRQSGSVLDIAYHHGIFLVATDGMAYAVSRDPEADVPNIQILPLPTVGRPVAIETATHGRTTAVVSTNTEREFALNFLGCF